MTKILSTQAGNRVISVGIRYYRLIIIAVFLLIMPALHAAPKSSIDATRNNVAGLTPVPEPPEPALVGLAFGIAVVWIRARKLKNKSVG